MPLPRPTSEISGARCNSRADPEPVGDGLRQGDRVPEVVEARREDGKAMGSRRVRLTFHERADALEVGLERAPLPVGQPSERLSRSLVEERMNPGLQVAAPDRIESEVEADRVAVLSPKRSELPQLPPSDRANHQVFPGGPLSRWAIVSSVSSSVFT